MPRLLKSILLAVIYISLFNVFLFFNKDIQEPGAYIRLIKDFVILLPTTILTFYLILLTTRSVSSVIIGLFFVVGVVNNYFYFNFNKVFDTGVLIDILTVESSLTEDFVSIKLILFALISFILVGILNFKISLGRFGSRFDKVINYSSVIVLVFIISIASNFSKRIFISTYTNYLPFNIFYSIYEYSKFRPHIRKIEEKNDLTDQYTFTLSEDTDQEPMTIILIIGESMRGDLISLNGYTGHNNMPLLGKREDLVSFLNAKSSATATRISVPYMLTSAVVPNFEQALSEKSIISIFKHLGFTTSWIGNQGIFGICETTYASNVMEADYYLVNKNFRKMIPGRIIYDNDMLPSISSRLQKVKNNHFMVIHMVGSHWSFQKRYPGDMKNKFMPECLTETISQCDREMLLNGYSNTILQSDYFLNEVLKLVEKKKAFVLYASDHGFSLGENGYYGNAYSRDNNIPKEQLNIAMFFWGAESFYNKNKGLFNKIEAKKSGNINHDYIFHTLLDCAKVKSSYIDNGLSLCK